MNIETTGEQWAGEKTAWFLESGATLISSSVLSTRNVNTAKNATMAAAVHRRTERLEPRQYASNAVTTNR